MSHCGRALDGELLQTPPIPRAFRGAEWPLWMEVRTKRTDITWAKTPSSSILSAMYHADLGVGALSSNPLKVYYDPDLDMSVDKHGKPTGGFEEQKRKWKVSTIPYTNQAIPYTNQLVTSRTCVLCGRAS